jgi:hypothetical protein
MPTEELTIQTRSRTTEITIQELTQFTPEVIRFIETVRWGTQGVLYTLKDYASTLGKVPSPLLILLRKHGELIGIRMLFQKNSRYGSKSIQVLYHGFSAVKAEEQGKGYGKILARYGLSRQRELLGRRGLVYAYVEDGNERNLNLLRGLSYTRIGQFHATMFGRLSPKDSPRVYRLHPEQEMLMCQLLGNLYADHTLADFDISLLASDYWVLIDRGEIMAGVQVDPQRWQIQEIPGPGGFLAQRILPHLPVLKKLFDPHDFRFLKLGNVYFQQGHADAAIELIETLLARYNMKAAMMYWDKRSPVYQQLATGGGFGLLNKLAETPVNVLGYFQGFHGNEIVDFCRHPMVISPLDAG